MNEKDFILHNPEQYDPEKHEDLFTEEEIRDLSQSLRG